MASLIAVLGHSGPRLFSTWVCEVGLVKGEKRRLAPHGPALVVAPGPQGGG